jgi:CHAT domain-containing protein/tetratricopeptide (TPR) repeat protein
MQFLAGAAVVLAVTLAGCSRQSPDTLYNDAESLRNRGQLKQALENIDRGISTENSWRFRLLKTQVLLQNGDAKEALGLLESPPRPDAQEDRARFAMLHGQADFMLSNNDQSDAFLNQAAALAATLSSPRLQAEIDVRRGTLRLRQGRTAEAEQFFRSTLKTASEIGDRRLKASAEGNLGSLLAETYRYDGAIYWLEQARAEFEQLGSAPDVGRAWGNLGWCYFRLGDNDRALDYLRKAEQSARSTGNRRDEQSWLGNLAGISYDRGDFHGAAANYREALSVARDSKDREWIRRWAESLAATQIELKEIDEAEESNREASEAEKEINAELRTPKTDLFILVNAARIEALRGNLTGAEERYRAMLSLSSDDPAPLLNAHSDLAQLLAKMGKGDAANKEYRETLAQISSQQANLVREDFRVSYLSGLIEFCDRYVDFLVSRGEVEPALEVTESIRARVLNERVSRPGSDSPATVAALKRAARASGSVFLSYWLAPERSFLWVIRPQGVQLHVLPPAKKIDDLAAGYRAFLETLRDPLVSEYPAGAQLSKILLEPVRDDLRNNAKIVIAPDRNLYSLNFDALPDPNDPRHYLIEKVRVSVAPSLAMLAAREIGTKPANRSLLLIGDAEPASPEYPRLPNAAREIALISQSFPADRLMVRSQKDAEPRSYLEASPSHFSGIHFAVHANASRESPLDSALILSPGPAGYTLTAREIMSVPLKADLVTLSACRSAGAKTYSGEGLVGLSWAFLKAGAGSVVAGLWDVTDMSTATLMGDFYARMAAGAAPADALREAKLKLVHSTGAFKKPFYWAPFQLYAGRL